MNKIQNDQAYMAKALQLAEHGLYTTRSNPRVGCVIVKRNQVIGRGFHLSPGTPHAEVMALRSISETAAATAEGATVYVSLEPCAHHGKTPPCAEALVKAKVSRVVCAIEDPNPLVNSKGITHLQSHDIETTMGVLETEAQALNKGFFKRMTTGRPFVTVKSAISLDGKTALASGESKWISSDESRVDVQKLRARSCAVMAGIDTVIADDPRLTVRLNKEQLGIANSITHDMAQPKRVILDTELRISVSASILQNPKEVLIYTCADKTEGHIQEKHVQLSRNGVEIITVKSDNHHIDLKTVMNDLATRGFNEVLVESGPTLIGSLLKDELVDEMVIYMAPHIMGHSSNGLAKLDYIQTMQDRIELEICQIRKIGSDLKLQIKPKY